MVRDLMLDMKERDLLMEDKSSSFEPVFDSLWGNLFDEDVKEDVLICNIIIPEAYWSVVGYENNTMTCKFKSTYVPNTSYFRVRLVALSNGNYSLFSNIRGDFGLPVSSYAITKNIASRIPASILPYIDIDGEYMVKLVRSEKDEAFDKAYIYSSKNTDISVSYSDDQASQLLSICAPGNSYRHPTAGVGITKYLNSVVDYSDLKDVLEKQFMDDNKPIYTADFDNATGKLEVVCNPEQEESDTGLQDLGDLCADFFSLFDDDYVRRNIVLNELSDTDFLELLNDYQHVLEIFMFTDTSTTANQIINRVEAGMFDAEGNVVESDRYYIVTATLEGGTIIMFDDELQDELQDTTLFIINGDDQTRLYTALIEQTYWLTEECHKCMILKGRATIKYVVEQERFRNGKGLYTVPQTSENIKNIAGLVQDANTGRLLGVVSNNTNINDMTLDEITQHIYAIQSNS